MWPCRLTWQMPRVTGLEAGNLGLFVVFRRLARFLQDSKGRNHAC